MDFQVKQGYKKTEVGIIPEDWEVTTFEKIANIIDPQPDHRTPPESSRGEPYIGISDFLNETTIDWENCRKIIPQAMNKQQASFKLTKGDIIFGKIGTIGLPKFLPVTNFRYSLSANVILIKPKIPSHFCMAWLKSSVIQKLINQDLHSTSQSAFGILKMRQLLIPLPPIAEQEKIAEALSDVDSLIESLEELIAKKRHIKQGAMQELLTGKKRLSGFKQNAGYKQTELGLIPEDWNICKLGEAVDFLDGQRRPIKASDREKIKGDYPYYGASGIVDYVNNYLFDEDLILLGEDGENILSRALPLVFIAKGKFWVNNHAHVLKPNNSFNIKYLAAFLESLDYSLLNSGTAQPKLNQQTCLKIEVLKPSKAEQTAIAEVLTDMDNEITALEEKLNKARQLKQGMMQELLTGKTRLI
ncbi:MAG: restriction endonuclease subunit S [Snowella sp.]|nr:restriction endonuclease subunit S [Snowella sp.]